MAEHARLKSHEHPYPDSPLRVYRTARLARLFDVSTVTIWRWRKIGKLPPPDSINGWSQAQIDALRAKRDGEAA